MTPALYCNGKIFTGLNHGDAFSKLSEQEKNSEIQSGFVNKDIFITDTGEEILLKKIIMIRHAKYEQEHVTKEGYEQIKKLIAFLNSMKIKEENFAVLHSPKIRCQETANEIKKECQVEIKLEQQVDEIKPEEQFDEFKNRIKTCMQTLPKNSIIISHCDFIQVALQLIQGHEHFVDIPNCSATLIINQKIIFCAKT